MADGDGQDSSRPDDQATTSTFPNSIASLELPLQSHSISSTFASLKRSTLSTRNRLQSIYNDSVFVTSISSKHALPCIANERCGSWYIPPKIKSGSAYFKSTDGHWGEWAFSMRRLNLHILNIIGESGGCIIVDSTRRGKRMPDALSKTVPIWCATLNRLLFHDRPESHRLRTPAGAVSESEHEQIQARLETFRHDAESLGLDACSLRKQLKNPLCPVWTTPASDDTAIPAELSTNCNKIICCTASRRIERSEWSEDGYIQGAGDDSESWASGLTPALFWDHQTELLSASDDSIMDVISNALLEKGRSTDDSPRQITPTGIFIGAFNAARTAASYDAIIACVDTRAPSLEESQAKGQPPTLLLAIGTGKLASRALRGRLPSVLAFLRPIYHTSKQPGILVICPTGRDLSVGIALAILCTFYDDQGNLIDSNSGRNNMDKGAIRRRFTRVVGSKPDANPSRTTLQSVHAFLMPKDGHESVDVGMNGSEDSDQSRQFLDDGGRRGPCA